MTWPLTPLTTYVAGTTPSIKAADLNAFQSGINGIIAGTYSLGGLTVDGTGGATVAARSAYTPLVIYKDASGAQVRGLVDHNGFPMGRTNEFREEWYTPSTAGGASGIIASRWYATINGTGNTSTAPCHAGTGSGGGGPSTSMVVNVDAGNGHYTYLGQANSGGVYDATCGMWAPWSYGSLAFEFELEMSSAGPNQTVYAGLTNGQIATPGVNSALWFSKTSAQTNWQAQAINAGGAPTTVDTGVAPTSLFYQRFRIEYHGSLTPIGVANGGAVALFFINEVLVATSTTNLPPAGPPSTKMSPLFGAINTAGLGGAQIFYVGPILARWNRALSVASL